MTIKKAAFINAIAKYSKIFLSLIVSAILARLLTPEDYGIVAVIMVFTTFFITISDMGFGAAVVQNKELSQNDINNIYSFTVYISLFLMLVFAVCSFPIALFYKDKVYIKLGLLLSISLVFNALNMVPNGILNREKKFANIAFRTIIVYIGSAIITVVVAFVGARYYSLVIQSIITAIFTFLWNYIIIKPKFYKKVNFSSVKKVFNFSSYQFAFNIINYFSRNLDNLLTGKFLGNDKLGYYNKAYILMLYPVNNLTGVISPVLHPILSDYQKQKKVIYEKYMRIIKLLMCIGLYVTPVCMLAANEIIILLYGKNWIDSIKCFQLLSLAIIPQMLNSSAGAIFQAIGNTRLLFLNSCINTIVTVLGILIGVFIGGTIEALSICVACAYCIHFCTAFFMLIKIGFGYKLRSFVSKLYIEFFILFIMIIASVVYPFRFSNIVLSILVKCLYLLIVFLIAMFISKEYKIFTTLFKK